MAIERTLSKTQKRIFVGLSQQRQEAIQALQEINEAQNEQIEMLRQKYDLPEGEYQIRQERNGDVVMFAVPKPKEDEKEADQDAGT